MAGVTARGRALLAFILCTLCAALATGCAPVDEGEPMQNQALIAERLEAADARIRSAAAQTVRNGAGTALQVDLVVSEPADADLLRAALAAVWRSATFRPNAVRLSATTPDGDSVRLHEAAERLAPKNWVVLGDGASFPATTLTALFGAWNESG